MKSSCVIRLGYTAKNSVTGYTESAFCYAKLEKDIEGGILNEPIEYGIVIDSTGAHKGVDGNVCWRVICEIFNR